MGRMLQHGRQPDTAIPVSGRAKCREVQPEHLALVLSQGRVGDTHDVWGDGSGPRRCNWRRGRPRHQRSLSRALSSSPGTFAVPRPQTARASWPPAPRQLRASPGPDGSARAARRHRPLPPTPPTQSKAKSAAARTSAPLCRGAVPEWRERPVSAPSCSLRRLAMACPELRPHCVHSSRLRLSFQDVRRGREQHSQVRDPPPVNRAPDGRWSPCAPADVARSGP